jgi:integrase
MRAGRKGHPPQTLVENSLIHADCNISFIQTRLGQLIPIVAFNISRAQGPLFLSESRRNHGQPLTLWTWSNVIRQIALGAGVPQFSTPTLRHLCLTDLARMGWEVHAIAAFAGHRHTEVFSATSRESLVLE